MEQLQLIRVTELKPLPDKVMGGEYGVAVEE